MKRHLPIGKLPPDILSRLLAQAPIHDKRVLIGPGIGMDCAVIDMGAELLVLKSDPITFASDEIGWYAVQVNANDIATAGARPRWFIVTLLLPELSSTPELVEKITAQVYSACLELDISIVGGHTEITFGLDRPILVGTLIGEVHRDSLVTPRGAKPGDRLLLTKGVPIEATAILAREFPERITGLLSPLEIEEARNYLHKPGISVLRDAQIALQSGKVNAMHDPTEGGLVSALWELAQASGNSIDFEPSRVSISPLSARLCQLFAINPLSSIASGALLLASPPSDAENICQAMADAGISCAEIGVIVHGPPSVRRRVGSGYEPLSLPERDEIARLFSTRSIGL